LSLRPMGTCSRYVGETARANDEMSAIGFPPGRGAFSGIKRHPNVAAHHSSRSQWTVLFAFGAIFKKNENLGRFSKARAQSEAILNDDVTFQTFAQKDAPRRCERATRGINLEGCASASSDRPHLSRQHSSPSLRVMSTTAHGYTMTVVSGNAKNGRL